MRDVRDSTSLTRMADFTIDSVKSAMKEPGMQLVHPTIVAYLHVMIVNNNMLMEEVERLTKLKGVVDDPIEMRYERGQRP